MRKLIKIALFLVLCTAQTGFAASLNWNTGVVKKIDVKNGRVTLKHGDIPDVMPAMTMSYPLPAPPLPVIEAGDKVRFVLEKHGEDYALSRIEVLR